MTQTVLMGLTFPGNEKSSSEDFQVLCDYRKVYREFLIPLVRFNHLYNL